MLTTIITPTKYVSSACGFICLSTLESKNGSMPRRRNDLGKISPRRCVYSRFCMVVCMGILALQFPSRLQIIVILQHMVSQDDDILDPSFACYSLQFPSQTQPAPLPNQSDSVTNHATMHDNSRLSFATSHSPVHSNSFYPNFKSPT